MVSYSGSGDEGDVEEVIASKDDSSDKKVISSDVNFSETLDYLTDQFNMKEWEKGLGSSGTIILLLDKGVVTGGTIENQEKTLMKKASLLIPYQSVNSILHLTKTTWLN